MGGSMREVPAEGALPEGLKGRRLASRNDSGTGSWATSMKRTRALSCLMLCKSVFQKLNSDFSSPTIGKRMRRPPSSFLATWLSQNSRTAASSLISSFCKSPKVGVARVVMAPCNMVRSSGRRSSRMMAQRRTVPKMSPARKRPVAMVFNLPVERSAMP